MFQDFVELISNPATISYPIPLDYRPYLKYTPYLGIIYHLPNSITVITLFLRIYKSGGSPPILLLLEDVRTNRLRELRQFKDLR